MVAAIGSATVSAASGGGFGTAGLEAQIARYEKQLSDCVNCSSAKTPEGKKTIAEISNKISATRERIDEVQATKQAARPTTADTASADRLPAAPPKRTDAMLGSRIDIFG